MYEFNTKEDIESNLFYLTYDDETEENEKIAQKCIQKAQQLNDKNLEFEARMAYLRQVNWLRKKEKAIATLPWLLKRLDEGYNLDYLENVLWMYKWIIINLPCFAAISLSQIQSLLADMERRFIEFGTGPRIIHYFKMIIYSDLGQLDLAKIHLTEYLKSNKKCSLDDCKACQPNNLLYVYLNFKDYKALLKCAKPLIQQKVSCKEVPDFTYPLLAFTNHILENTTDAADLAIIARKKIKLDRPLLHESSFLIMYYALTKEYVKGKVVIEKQIDFCNDNHPELRLFSFYLAASVFYKSLLTNNKKTIKLKIKSNNLIPLIEGTSNVQNGYDWLLSKVEQLAQKLNNRNQNNFYSEQIETYLKLIKT